jgi:hypothetical protein
VPLSEEELRLLEQMERALVEEDPKLASTMRGTSMRAAARRRALVATVAFVLGVVILMTGAVTQLVVVGIIGFVVMLASAVVALSSWRGQDKAPEKPRAESGPHATFSVIDGGRKSKRRSGREQRSKPQSSGSMMDRFEERWRRRRDQNGY